MGTMSAMASGRRLLVGMLVLFVCDVIGGFLAVVSGVATWGEAWGFDTKFTVPLPVGAVQLVLAWLAARNVRPPVGLVAAVVLGVLCLISLLFGLFDGDLTNEVASTGYPGGGRLGGRPVGGHRRCRCARRRPGEAAVPASLTAFEVRRAPATWPRVQHESTAVTPPTTGPRRPPPNR